MKNIHVIIPVWLLVLVFGFGGATPAAGQELSPEKLTQVGFRQNLGAQVPLNLGFRDETGAPAQLSQILRQRPAILVLAYYDCPNLCTVVLNGLLESVRQIRLDVGRDFDVVVVSIRPNDPPQLAAEKKRAYTRRYARPGTSDGWHFLTGEAEAISTLAETVGFDYVYDPASGHFAHASGLILLTPQGRITRYFLGIEYPPKDLRLSLVEASREKIGTLADRLILLCFHFDPAKGRYGLIINRALQIGGIGTVLLLGVTLYRLGRRERRRQSRTLEETP